MKFLSFYDGNLLRSGLLNDGVVLPLSFTDSTLCPDLSTLIRAGEDLHQLGTAAAKNQKTTPLRIEAVTLAPVLPNPGKIICLGLNYFDHAKEGGREKPQYPWFFMRASSSLAAHRAAACLPSVSSHFDFEAELAVVIGKSGKHIKKETAASHVLGYACFNDMSVRDYQKKTPQWTIGKNFDATGAFGPYLVTHDELPEGAKELRIQCRLNGEIMQDANTSDMIFDVNETIELLSECMTLEAGDVLVMGTPAGVGFARNPPIWLKDGDIVEVEIERVGSLRNAVIEEKL